MSKELINKFNTRFDQLKKDRRSYEAVWQDIIDYIAPDLDGYINKRKGKDQEGDRSDIVIYDGSPVDDCLKCATGLFASICSPSRPWYTQDLDDVTLSESPEARKWLDEETELKNKIMHSSNFYQAIYTVWLHLAAIGTACMLMLPDYDSVIRCITLNVGQYWLGTDDNNKVDTIYREFDMTAAQLMQKFGDKVPQKIRDSVTQQQQSEQTYCVIHAIEPNFYNMGTFPKDWVSVYYLSDGHENDFLQVSGFNFFPAVAPRWFTNYGETYGKMNPGRNALPDCKQLQTMVYDYHEALQKVNNPPLQGHADILENNQVVTIPGSYNPLQSGTTNDTMIKPLFAINPDLTAQWNSILDKKDQISKKFYVDMFLAISMRQDKDMTAEEVRALSREQMLGLSPVLENTNNELLDPILDITFQYELEAGIVPEPPKEIEGKQINPNYVSVLAQAQKFDAVERTNQIVNMAIQYATATQDPSILDNINFDVAIESSNKVISTPAGVIRSQEEKEQIRAQRQQMQQTQQMAESAQQAADIAKTASAVNMDGDNALARLMQMGGMQ